MGICLRYSHHSNKGHARVVSAITFEEIEETKEELECARKGVLKSVRSKTHFSDGTEYCASDEVSRSPGQDPEYP